MKVEFLKGLGLDDDIIKQIQAESGKDVTNAKANMQSQIDSLTNQVSDLTSQLDQRGKDLTELQGKFEQAGQSASKLNEIQQNFADLQAKYDADTQAYKKKLDDQQYEFSTRELAKDLKFTSKAAEKDFFATLMSNPLPMKDGKIIGFDDYVKSLQEADPGSFVTEEKKNPAPEFIPPANPSPVEDTPKNEFGFHFLGVH